MGQYVQSPYLVLMVPGPNLGFSEGGAKPNSGSLKQGIWGCNLPEAIGSWVFEVSKCKI